MQLKIQSIFRSLEPYKVAAELGYPITETNGFCCISHPGQDVAKLVLTNSGFVSTLPTDFTAGNVFDFMALHFGSYEQAIDYTIEKYHHLADLPPGINLESLRHALVSELKLTRKQFTEITELRNNLMLGSPKMVEANIWLRSQGLSVPHVWPFIYACKGEELNRLFRIVTIEDAPDVRFDSTHTFVVFPFFSNHHTISMLRVMDVTQPTKATTVSLQPARYAYFGLPSYIPGNFPARVYAEALPVAADLSFSYLNAHTNVSAVAVHFNPSVPEAFNVIRHGVFMMDTSTHLSTLVKHRFVFDEFGVADRHQNQSTFEALQSTVWRDYVLTNFQAIIREENVFNTRVASFVEQMKPDQEICRLLVQWLEQNHRPDLLRSMRRQLDHYQHFTKGAVTVSETNSGYVARRNGTNHEVPFTNFVLRIDGNVLFEEVKEMYHHGRVLINGSEYPLFLPRRVLQNANDVEAIATSAVSKGGGKIAPAIMDSTFKGHLANIVTTQSSNKPFERGIKTLGWNKAFTQFVTPTWEAKGLGLQPTSKIPYPASTILFNYYSFQEPLLPAELKPVTSQVRSFIALVVSLMGRAVTGKKTPVQRVMYTPQAKNLLHGIFHPFGQVKPIEINPNRRGSQLVFSASDLSHYPFFATCANEEVLSSITLPVVVLSNAAGLPFHENQEGRYTNLCKLSSVLMPQVVLGFIRHNASLSDYFQIDNPTAGDLMQEGRRIIERMTSFTDFQIFDSALPMFRSLLSEIAFDNVASFFRFDLAQQRVYLSFRKIKNYLREEMLKELQTRIPEAAFHGDRYIAMPAGPVLELLKEFYGRPPALFHSAEEAPESTPPTPLVSSVGGSTEKTA